MAETKKSSKFFTPGWIQVVVAFVVAIVTQGFGIYHFGMLKVPMTEALGAQPAEVALGFSIYALAAGFASLVVGDVINKIKLRGSMLCSAVLFSGGFLILGLMTEIWQVYVAYVVMGVGSALGGMVILSGIPNNWFNKRRGIATAIIWSAMFPGSLVVGQIIPAATASGNWQMAPFALAGIAFVILIVGAFLLKWQPQEVGLLPDGMTEEEAAAAKDTVVATMGDEQLTNGKLQVYYWNVVQSILSSNYGYSLMYQGLLDYSQPLDTQLCSEDSSLTWQQFFLGEALNYWQMYQSLALEAKNAGMEMPAEDREYLDGLEASLEETAANYGLSGIEELLLKNVGPGAGLEEFAGFQELYYQGKPYYTAETEKLVPTPEDLEAYYTENESYFTGNGVTKDGTYVSVRHILVMPEGGTTGDDGTTTYSDEEWAACEKKAQEILDEWLAGDATEDSFAALAEEKSEDPGSSTNGGLYENVAKGQMVEPFEDWCFDETRAAGDYGLVKTKYGYHIMYYVSSTPIWETYAKSGWVNEKTNAFIKKLAEDHPMEVDYSAIKLGYVNLGA